MSTARESFHILGRSLHLRLRTPELRAWLEREWRFPEHERALAEYSIYVEEVAAPPARPAGAPVRVPLHRITLTALAADDAWWFGDERTGVQLRLSDAESRIVVWGVEDEEKPSVTRAALFVSVAESLRASGLLPLHAAVAVRDGSATALTGRSGVGKSTTLWRLMRAGWAPLAEDFAWLDPATRLTYGWDRGLRLWPETRDRFAPEAPAEDFRTDPDGKLFLAYDRIPGPTVRVATLGRLALLERDVDCTTASDSAAAVTTRALVPLAPHEAVRAWWETIGLPLAPQARERVAAAIAELVQCVDAVRLPLAPDQGPLALE